MASERIEGRLSDEQREKMRRLATEIDAEQDEMRHLADRALARRLAEAVIMLAGYAERGDNPPTDRLQEARELAERTLALRHEPTPVST